MKNNNQARNRALALKCLEKLPSRLSYTKLFPYRQTILKGLIPVLDDRKQAVRQIAAKVRSKWSLLEVMES
ncbi:MAG: hypothetical protein M1365_15760 [Actinobacteria bacterium]|nr:hypothetical protein [Actinomycetota bacterium]